MAKRLFWALLVLFGLCAPARAHDPGMTVATVTSEERETLTELSVKRRFPEANTTLASVAWYRSKLRREGAKVTAAAEAIPCSAAKIP